MRALIAIVLALSAAPSTAQPLPQLQIDELERAIGEGELGKMAVLAAEQHGETVYHRRFDDQTPDKPIDIKSAGKSVTALAVGAAIADGKLDGTDVAVWPYLGASRGEPFDSITVGDLLGMSAPLDCNDWERRSPGQEERMYRQRV